MQVRTRCQSRTEAEGGQAERNNAEFSTIDTPGPRLAQKLVSKHEHEFMSKTQPSGGRRRETLISVDVTHVTPSGSLNVSPCRQVHKTESSVGRCRLRSNVNESVLRLKCESQNKRQNRSSRESRVRENREKPGYAGWETML